jgi:hypothetical protein
VVRFKDGFTGLVYGIRCVQPTTEQRVRYKSLNFRRDESGKFVGSGAEATVTIGRELIVGLLPDCFKDEVEWPVSSDPKDDNYKENWRELAVDSGCLDQAAIWLALTLCGNLTPMSGQKISKKK